MKLACKCLVVCVLLFSPFLLFAKDGAGYSVADISPAMLENADAVIRCDESVLNIVSPSRMEWRIKYAITILKESGLDKSTLTMGYNKSRKINSISTTVYDAKGVRVKKLKQEDIRDYSAIDGGTMFSDSRVKHVDPRYQTYPFTVEHEVSVTLSSTFFIPRFSPFTHFNTSVEQSSITVTAPDTYNLRYKEYNNMPVCEQTTVGTTVKYFWQCAPFVARNKEPLSPDPYEVFPYLNIAPSDFEFEGYKGNMESWQNFGRFIAALNTGKDELPLATVAKMQELVKDCTSDAEKVKLVYEYSQQKNRYVSIQLGIGGWQPFSAKTVDEVSYGDCKALSNYTVALLKSVGVKAHYVVIEAGDVPSKLDVTFPHNQFNHAVVCVPLDNDTIWLECTNPHLPCGYFGDFTHNRYALLVDGDNSRLVKTKAMSGATNTTGRTGTITLGSSGDAYAEVQTQFAGINYGNYLKFMLMDDKDRRKYIIKHIDIPNFQLVDYKMSECRTGNPYIQLNAKVDLPSFMTKTGTRLIMPINQYNVQRYIPSYARKRESPLFLVNDVVEVDTMVYRLPTNYKVEALPEPVSIDTPYGSYKSRCEVGQGTITYYRSFCINDGEFKPELYNDFRAFVEKVSAADNAKCILIPK
jgi:transglutaminase-like putative cysteine protease